MSRVAGEKVIHQAFEDENIFHPRFKEKFLISKGYDLTPEEWMHIRTGDVPWIETDVNEKFDSQLVEKVPLPILSREMW